MPITVDSSDTIKTAIVANIKSNLPQLDVSALSEVNDLIVATVDQGISPINQNILTASKLQSVENVANFTIDDMVALAANRGLTRKSATYATVQCIIGVTTIPQADIIINIGDLVNTNTSSGTVKQYKSLETKTISIANITNYYIAAYNVWGVYVLCQAISAGSTYMVDSGLLTSTSVRGATFCTNPSASTGGNDAETTTELYNRYIAAQNGTNIGTIGGIKNYLLATFNDAKDISVVPSNSIYATRVLNGNEVDVYIRERSFSSRTEQFTMTASLSQILTLQPVFAISLVTNITTGVVLAPGTYLLIKDTSAYGGSYRASDYIQIYSGASAGQVISVTYLYNILVNNAQAEFALESNEEIGADILVKEASTADLYWSMQYKKVSSAASSEVEANIRDTITNYINAFLLGVDVEKFMVLQQLTQANVPGLDNVILDSVILRRLAYSGDQDTVVISPIEYAQINSANINLIEIS